MLHLNIKPKGSQEMNRSWKKPWFSGGKPLNINLGNLGLFFSGEFFHGFDPMGWNSSWNLPPFLVHFFQVAFWVTRELCGWWLFHPFFFPTDLSIAEVGAAPGATLKGRHAAGRPSPMPGPGRKWWEQWGRNFRGSGEWLWFLFFVCFWVNPVEAFEKFFFNYFFWGSVCFC